MLLIMLPLKRINKSRNYLLTNLVSTSSVSQFLLTNQRQENPTTSTLFFSNHTILSSSSSSASTSIIQHQQFSFEEPYSPKTGIKTAALLGGMLLFVVISLLWKARSRLCFYLKSSTRTTSAAAQTRSTRVSGTKFDLDYWLKQVDLLEAKEAERNRECLSPYLELPQEEPRDNERATASWIGDAWRHWRLVQYRQQHRLIRQRVSQQTELNPVPYRRRRQLIRRFFRRMLLPSHQHPAYLIEQSPSLIAEMRPSIVNNELIPSAETLDVQPRRVASWPRVKASQQDNGTMLSALQTHNTRKRLLKRVSRTTTTFNI